MEYKLYVSPSPHISSKESISRIMWTVFFCLLPSGLTASFIFGARIWKIILVSIISSSVTEALIQRLRKKEVTIFDGSAAITGLLLAYNLPPSCPLWLPAVGAAFSIAIAKQAFGGLGFNIFNPALVGRIFLMTSWPKYMTTFLKPFSYDGITAATPLALMKEFSLHKPIYWDLFIGNRGGCIGEVCILALLLGAAFLLLKGYITWHIPLSYIGTVGLFSGLFMGNGLLAGDWLFHILSGGLILGAFFMATDYVTAPLTRKGQAVFGFGCGLLTFCIRKWGGYPEGASYAILMMNAATPIIDRFTRPKKFGFK